MKKITIYFLSICAIISVSSCATLFTGTRQTVKITTNPPGAAVEINGMSQGNTPIDVSLKKSFNGQTIVLKKDGYEDKTIQATVTFNPVSLLNLFGLIGWAVDGATGAIMKYDPIFYEVPLTKKPKQ